MKSLFLILVFLVSMVSLSSAQVKSESELAIMKEFLSKDVPVTTELRSFGLVGNPDFPVAELIVVVKRFSVDQIPTSGRYYVVSYDSNGKEVRQYLEYLTGNQYEGNTVFANSNTKPTEFFIWQLDTNFKLNKINVPTSVFGK
jgi:hypothetical protein